jgi:hypothetical protein
MEMQLSLGDDFENFCQKYSKIMGNKFACSSSSYSGSLPNDIWSTPEESVLVGYLHYYL